MGKDWKRALSDAFLKLNSEQQPACDLVSCNECGWKGTVADAVEVEDGDWESGYFTAHDCPQCEDGGELEYDYSPEQFARWEKWWKEHHGTH